MKSDRKILVAFILNAVFSIVEFIGGLITGSVAILSDSIHDLGDSISIGLAYILEKISKKDPDNSHTYGYLRYSMLGSLITTLILIIGSVFVVYNAIIRIINPVEINYSGMILLAIFGVLVNFIASYFTTGGHSLNQKAVNLHMFEDMLGWVVVLIGAIIMKFTDVTYIDPIMSICVAIFIFISSIKNLLSIMNIFLEKVPDCVHIDDITEHLIGINGVVGVHHFHVRSIDGFNNIATVHVVTDSNARIIKKAVKDKLKEHGIIHTTVEIETTGEECSETQCNVFCECHAHHHHHH